MFQRNILIRLALFSLIGLSLYGIFTGLINLLNLLIVISLSCLYIVFRFFQQESFFFHLLGKHKGRVILPDYLGRAPALTASGEFFFSKKNNC